jgi:hypothetical protein
MGIDDYRLGVSVADDTDSGCAVPELIEFVLELASEIGTLQIVDGPLETVFLAVGGKSATLGSHV